MKILNLLIWIILISRPFFAAIFPLKSYYLFKDYSLEHPSDGVLKKHRIIGIILVIVISIFWYLIQKDSTF